MHWSLIVLLKKPGDSAAKKPDQLFQFRKHAVNPLEDKAMCL